MYLLKVIKHFLRLKIKEIGSFLFECIKIVGVLLGCVVGATGLVLILMGIKMLQQNYPYIFCYTITVFVVLIIWIVMIALGGATWEWLCDNWSRAKYLAKEESNQ